MNKKLKTGIISGMIALAGLAGAGKVYADASSKDISLIDNYAKTNGNKYSLSINGNEIGPLYIAKKGPFTIEYGPNANFTMIRADSGESNQFFYDSGSDGSIESVVIVPGGMNPSEVGELELELYPGGNPQDIAGLEMNNPLLKQAIGNRAYSNRRELFFKENGSVTSNDYSSDSMQNFSAGSEKAEKLKTIGSNLYENISSYLANMIKGE